MDKTTVPELEYKSLGSEPLRNVVIAFLKERAEEGGLKVEGGDGDAGSVLKGGMGDGNVDDGGDANISSSSTSPHGQSNNVVASGDTASTPSSGKCPFFRASVEMSADERTAEEVMDQEKVEKVEEQEEEEEETMKVAVENDDAEEEVARVAAATTAGIEPWPTAGAGVAAASTPPSSWYYDDDAAGSFIHTHDDRTLTHPS